MLRPVRPDWAPGCRQGREPEPQPPSSSPDRSGVFKPRGSSKPRGPPSGCLRGKCAPAPTGLAQLSWALSERPLCAPRLPASPSGTVCLSAESPPGQCLLDAR